MEKDKVKQVVTDLKAYCNKFKSVAVDYADTKKFIDWVVSDATMNDCSTSKEMDKNLASREFVHLCGERFFEPVGNSLARLEELQELYDRVCCESPKVFSELTDMVLEFQDSWGDAYETLHEAEKESGIELVDFFGDDFGHVNGYWYRVDDVDILEITDIEAYDYDHPTEYFISVQ